HTLLARRVAAGHPANALAMRWALEDAWCDPLVNRRWQRLALQLTPAECERIIREATRRGWAGAGLHCLDAAAATDGWALDTAGHAVDGRQRRRTCGAGAATRRLWDEHADARRPAQERAVRATAAAR